MNKENKGWLEALDAVATGKLGLSADGFVRLYSAVSAHVNWLNLPDVSLQDEGSIVVFYLNSTHAQDWVEENVDTENAQWWTNNGLVVEHRFADHLAEGLRADGLEVV